MENTNKIKFKKKVYLVTGMLISLTVIFFLISNSGITASTEYAVILFVEESHDFGKVEQGSVIEYSFKFTNGGDKPLVIEKVQPSCGCTGVTTDGKSEYKEGENGEIKLTFNTQGREGFQEKHVMVISNDTANPKKDLRFSCDVLDIIK